LLAHLAAVLMVPVSHPKPQHPTCLIS
jgi:hypothetical protein